MENLSQHGMIYSIYLYIFHIFVYIPYIFIYSIYLYILCIFHIFVYIFRCDTKLELYAEHARLIWKENGEKWDNLNIETMVSEIKSFFQPKSIKNILDGLALGHFTVCNQEVEMELMKNMWIREIYMDASHQTQENVIVKHANDSRMINVLKVTESRACINMGLNIGDIFLLESGKERHEIMYGKQAASIYANNMKYIYPNLIPKELIIHTQSDRATHENANNIRGILVSGIKKILEISPDSPSWIRPLDGSEFRFDTIRYFHSQEVHHIPLRLQALGAFKRSHSDNGIVRKDIKVIINNIRLQYNPVESPPILYTAEFDGPKIIHEYWLTPYELFHQTKYIKDTKYFYTISRAVRALWMRRKTKKEKLKRELDKYWHEDWTQGIGRAKLRQEFTWIIKHSVPHLIGAFFSVKYIFLIYILYILYILYVLYIYIQCIVFTHLDILGWY